jgi:hypothetical protein
MSEKLTPAQQRVLNFLCDHESDGFIGVPSGVSNDNRTLDALIAKGLIEGDWKAHTKVFRAVRPMNTRPMPEGFTDRAAWDAIHWQFSERGSLLDEVVIGWQRDNQERVKAAVEAEKSAQDYS